MVSEYPFWLDGADDEHPDDFEDVIEDAADVFGLDDLNEAFDEGYEEGYEDALDEDDDEPWWKFW